MDSAAWCFLGNADLQNFWALRIGRDETDWHSFWAAFAIEPSVHDIFRSHLARESFQKAINVNGDCQYPTTAAMDASFAAGISIRQNVLR